MKQLMGGYNFAETWAEINPRFVGLDSGEYGPNLSIKLFTDLDVERDAVINSDCSPVMIQSFMVRVSVALSYCSVLVARLGGHLTAMQEHNEYVRAQKAAKIAPTMKSDAALERQLTIDPEVIKSKWSVEDLKVCQTYAENMFRVLQKDAEMWRARFYGVNQDRKLQPGVEDPAWSDGPGGAPPRIGGR